MSKNARSRLWTRCFSRKPAPELPLAGLRFEQLEDRLAPATFTWTGASSGAGANANWSNPGNWQGGVAPSGAVIDLVFPAGAQRPANFNDLATGTGINRITVQGTGAGGVAYNISESPSDAVVNSIVLSGSIEVGPNSGAVLYTLPTTLATNGDQSFTVDGSGSTLTINAPVSAGVLNNLNKDGVGRLILQAGNPNLLGGVKVNSGTLEIRHVLALGPAGGTETVVSTNTGLYLNNVVTVPGGQDSVGEQVRLNGGGFDPVQGALYNESGNTVWSGRVILETGITSPPQAGGPGTVIGAAAGTVLNITGVISDSGAGMGLVKEGAGEVKLGSPTGNTYRGQTNINFGVLTATHALSLGDSRPTTILNGFPANDPRARPQPGNFGTVTGAFQNPTSGTVVNVSSGRSGQLRLEAPAGSAGFSIVGEYLVLNGAADSGTGTIFNTQGNNDWAGSVILGSSAPDGRDVTIGVGPAGANPSSLTISGVVDDPNRPGAVLTKNGAGRLILTASNQYDGNTIIAEGTITIRDSQGLGTAGGAGATFVRNGAALELDVEAAYDESVAPRYNLLGRDTWADSITGDSQRLRINETITLTGRGPGSTAPGTGLTFGLSTGGTGALRSVTGINRWESPIAMLDTFQNFNNVTVPLVTEVAIGVESDGSGPGVNGTTSRAGHPTPDISYFQSDYSLTIVSTISGTRLGDLVKRGAGNLILPNANPYLGRTLIEQGWITAQSNRSLGDSTPDTTFGETAQQPTIVSNGAALHIVPTAPGVQIVLLEEKIVLEGLGITHPYTFISQKGALLNVGGDNIVAGDIGLINTYPGGVVTGQLPPLGAGIGVERAAVVEFPPLSGTFVQLPSSLILTGDLSDGVRYQTSFSGTTGATETARVYDTGATSGRVTIPFSMRPQGDTLRIYYPPRGQPGSTLIYDSGGPVSTPGLATVNFSGTSTQIEVVVDEGGGRPGPSNNPATNAPFFWTVGMLTSRATPQGPLSQVPGSFVKLGSETLFLQGSGSQTGGTNEVREGTLRLQNETALGRATTGTEITQQTYNLTQTVVANGARLELAGSVAMNAGGVAAGLQVNDERLVLNEYGVQIRVTGQPTSRFRLDFGGQRTRQLMVPAAYPGYSPADSTAADNALAADLQAAINADLTGIAAALVAGIPGATPADAQATVVRVGPGVFAVTFGAARFNDLNISALTAFIEPVGTTILPVVDPMNPATVAALSEVRINGTNAPLVSLSDDNTWRGPVDLNRGTRIEVRPNSRLTLLGDIKDGNNPDAAGSDLVKRDAGDLTLGGSASTFRGTTWIDEGIVTAVSSRAFGDVTGGTIVADGAQLQIQGSLTIAGEALSVAGDGTATLPALDSALRWLNVGPGATNNGVAPPYSPEGAPTSARINSIATDPTDPRVIYVATAGGGAWKTKDGGLTWMALFDLAVQSATNTPLTPPTDATAGGTGLLPLSAMMFGGSIAVAPNNPAVVYYATGDSNGTFNGIPETGQTDNYAGSGVYRSVDSGRTWTRLLNADGSNPLYGQAVTKVIVDPLRADRIYVASSTTRTLAFTPNNVPNGSTNPATRAGVWRFTEDTDRWVNLTGQTSNARRSIVGTAPYDVAAPNNAGPDDDYRVRFPSGEANNLAEAATWSDIQLVLRGVNPNTGQMQYTLYAALGESTQTYFTGVGAQAIRNAVYRSDGPELSFANAGALGMHWWLGQGTYNPIVPIAATTPDGRAAGIDVGPIPPPNPAPPPGRFGYIKIAVASTANEVWSPANGPGASRVQYANVTLYAGALWRDFVGTDNQGNPAPQDPLRGELRELLKTVANVTANPAGYAYTVQAAPPTPFGAAVQTNGANGRPAQGRYDFTLAVGDYDQRVVGAGNSASNVADNNPNEVYLGGLDSIFRSTDGAASWAAVPNDDRGFGPAEQHHAIAFDTSNRLLIGTDGGLWRWDRFRFSNLNSNLPVVQFNSVDPHPIDFRQAVGGASDTGTQAWNGNTIDGTTGVWRRLDDASTTTTAGQSGSVSGVVRYDPFNPQTIYAARDGQLRRSDDGGATWTLLDNVTTQPPVQLGPLAYTHAFNLFPLVVDPLTPNRIVYGGVLGLFESTNRGTSRVNLNLTPAILPRVVALAGFQGDFAPDPRFTTVTEGLPNTPDPRTIYVSDGATILVTKNRGVSWAGATGNLVVPAGGSIVDLVVNPVNRDEVYAVVTARPGQTGGRVWRSLDAGQTWTNLTGVADPDTNDANVGPLPSIPVWKAAIDPRSGNLYLGTDNGVWVLVDPAAADPANLARTAGAGTVYWRRLGDGMPNVQVRDLVINQTTSILTAGTYGRGMFQVFLPDYAAASGAVRAVSGTSRWTGPVTLTGDTRIGTVGTQQIQNGLNAASLDLGGTVSGAFNIEKVGQGTLILSAANTYTGQTVVTQGVLEVKNPTALGAPTGNTVVQYGAALQVRSDIEAEPITINGDGILFNGRPTGALRNISGNNVYNGVLTLGTGTFAAAPQPPDANPAQVTIGVDSGSSLRIGQNPAGPNPGLVGRVDSIAASSQGIDKELPGTLILSGANTAYLGFTEVIAGALEVRDGQALGPVGSGLGTLVRDGAAVRIANATPGTPTVVADEVLTLSGTGTPDGPGGLGTGALRNTGGDNTWAGPITLDIVANTNPPTNPGSQIAFGVSNPMDVLTVSAAGGITENAAKAQFGLIKVGPGILRLEEANQYTGVTNVNEGTLRVANADALGAVATSSEVQTIRVFGVGTYQLNLNGQLTTGLTANPTGGSGAAAVAAAIEQLIAGAGSDVLVTETPNANGRVFTVTFRGRFAGQNVPALLAANVSAGVTVTVDTPQPGGLGTVVAAGASLELDGTGLTVNETLTLNGAGVTDAGGVRYGALGNRGGNNTYGGTVTIGTATTLGAQPGSMLTVTGRVLGQPNDPTVVPDVVTPAAPELTKVGGGTVVFPNDKEYRGRTVVAEGALQIASAGALGVARSETQLVRITGAFGTTRYTISYLGETTDPIVLQADAAGATALYDALTQPRAVGATGGDLLPMFGPGDVVVTAVTVPAAGAGEPGESVFEVRFTGQLANTNVPLLTDISPATPTGPTPITLPTTTIVQGQPPTPIGANEVQTITVPNTGGTFTLNSNGFGAISGPLPGGAFSFDTSLAAVQAALNTAYGVTAGVPNALAEIRTTPGNNARLFRITFQQGLANTNVPQITGAFTPDATVRVQAVEDGVGSETQVVDVQGTSGQYTLRYTNPLTGQVVTGTRLLVFNASEAAFQAALADPQANGGLGLGGTFGTLGAGSVRVTRSNSQGGFQYLVQFRGALGNLNLLPIQVVPVAGSSVTSSTSTLQDGPEGTVVLAGAALQVRNDGLLGAMTTETVTLNGDGLAETQTLDVLGTTGAFTLSYTNPFTGQVVTGTAQLPFDASAAAVLAALTDAPGSGGLGIGAGNVRVSRSAIPGGFRYTIEFAGTFANVDLQPIQVTPAGAGVTGTTVTLQEGATTGALQMVSSTTPVINWDAPLILGSTAAIGVDDPANYLVLRRATTDRNQYAAPTAILGPTNVRGPNQTFGVNKVGAGILDYAAAGDNDYLGTTTVRDGTLFLNHSLAGGTQRSIRGDLVVGDGTGAVFSARATALQDNQVADASVATVLADGIYDLNGRTDTIARLNVLGGHFTTNVVAPTGGTFVVTGPIVVGDPLTPAVGGTVFVAAGGSLTSASLTMTDGFVLVGDTGPAIATFGPVDMAAGAFLAGGDGSVVNTGAVTAVDSTVAIDDNGLLNATGVIDLTNSTLRVGEGFVAGPGATATTNGNPITARAGSTIQVGDSSTLTTATASTRGAVNLTDSNLFTGSNSTVQTGPLTLDGSGTGSFASFGNDSLLNTAGDALTVTNSTVAGATGVDLLTGAVTLTDSVLNLGFGPSALLNTGGQDITLARSLLRTLSGGVTVTAGGLTATGGATFAERSLIDFRDDTTATFAGAVSLTQSDLIGTVGVDVSTQTLSLDDAEFGLGDGPDASLTTNGQAITLTNDSLLAIGAGATLSGGSAVLVNSTLALGTLATAGVTGVTLTNGHVTLDTGSALTATGTVTTVADAATSDVTGAGSFVLGGAGDQTVSVADGAAVQDFRITSLLTATGAQNLVKTDTGRLTLAPAGTGFGNDVVVRDGDVQVDTVTADVVLDRQTGTNPSVSGVGTTGAISGTAGTAAQGTVSPGDNGAANPAGILTATDDVTLGAGSVFRVNLAGTGSSQPTAGVHYDQLRVTGAGNNVALGNGVATLQLVVDAANIRNGDQFTIIDTTGAGTISGTFAETGTAGFVFVGEFKFRITYTSTTVVLEKVKTDTNTVLTSSNSFGSPGSPSTLNQPVTFTATVTSETGSAIQAGSGTFVQFQLDGVDFGAPVAVGAGGVASATFANIPAGTHTVVAHYIGDTDNFNPSDSAGLQQVVETPAVALTPPAATTISPNNATSVGVNDSVALAASVTQERSAYSYTLTVTSVTGGAVVFTTTTPVAATAPLNTSTITTSWDGTRNTGGTGFVADGDYTVVISILDQWGNTASTAALTVRVDNTSPAATGTVDEVVIQPDAPNPPADATTFTGTVTDANPGTWAVTVRDANGAVVKVLTGTGTAVSAVWDGTDAANAPVAPGTYTLTLVATDAAGNTSPPVAQTVFVVTEALTVLVTSGPGAGSTSGQTTYGEAVTLTAFVSVPASVAGSATFLSGRPVEFHFPGTGTLTAALAPTDDPLIYQASVVVPLDLAAGTYGPVTATLLSTDEFLTATSLPATHTVIPAQLRVSAGSASRPYGDANPAFTYTVTAADLKFGDTAAVVSGVPTTAATQASNAGSYPITQGSVAAGPNYTVVFTDGTLTVTQVPLTIRINDATRTRFAQNPAFTATYEGLKLSDTGAVVGNLNLVTTATPNSLTGTYPITAQGTPTATNYFPITVVGGTLTVTDTSGVTVIGSGGAPAQIQVVGPDGTTVTTIPVDPVFAGGIRTATGDFNKDGVIDYVLATGPGTVAVVQVIDGATGGILFQVTPFEGFTGGAFVAAGDMTGDGAAELVVTPDEGGGPRVVIYRGGDFAPLVSYFAIDDANFRGGVRPAVGDINGDGFADLAVSAGFGGGPRISLWDGQRLGKLEFVNLVPDFFAFEQELRNGAFVAIGDVDGDGFGDLVAGAGPGGGPRVKVYSGTSLLSLGGGGTVPFADFFAGNVNNRGGVKVAAKNLDGDKFIDVVTGGGLGDRAVATAYRGSALAVGQTSLLYEVDLDGTLNGVFVG